MKRVELRAVQCAGCLLVVEKRGRGRGSDWDAPPPPLFLQECDSMGVRWWGCAKDVILKGIVASGDGNAGDRREGGV